MFRTGDLVVYGTTGVCRVMGITTLPMGEDSPGDSSSADRLYYELKPYFQKESRIMTPVENQKVPMRPILNENEAKQLIEDMPSIEALWIESDKTRENQYKECIRSADCRQWIQIIKTLYNRRQERMLQGKRMTTTDERYLKQAEDYLYSELSIPLGLSRENVESYIVDSLHAIGA